MRMLREKLEELSVLHGESKDCLLDPYAATVVKEEYIDAHEPAAHGPDGVARPRFGEGFEDGAEPKESAVDQNGRFGCCETLLVAGRESRGWRIVWRR